MQNVSEFMTLQIKYNPESIQGMVNLDDILFNSDGDPNIFYAYRDGDTLKLNTNYAYPDYVWNDDNQFVFSIRKCFYFSCSLAGVLLWML